MTTPSAPRISDPKWLAGVRRDLDSSADQWIVKTPSHAISKLEALGQYLDVILTELGHKNRLHACPECGVEHMAPER